MLIAFQLEERDLIGLFGDQYRRYRYLDAARWQERALIEHPSATWIHRTLCPAYVLAGAAPEARRSLIALREHYTELTIAKVQQALPPLPQTFGDRVVDALHEVGLPH